MDAWKRKLNEARTHSSTRSRWWRDKWQAASSESLLAPRKTTLEMFEEEHDLTPAAIAPWWNDFERAFWERGCQSTDNVEYGVARTLSRDRTKLHWVAADFIDLDPELAVIKLFKRGLLG